MSAPDALATDKNRYMNAHKTAATDKNRYMNAQIAVPTDKNRYAGAPDTVATDMKHRLFAAKPQPASNELSFSVAKQAKRDTDVIFDHRHGGDPTRAKKLQNYKAKTTLFCIEKSGRQFPEKLCTSCLPNLS